jgi:hypothetical protein
MSPLQPSCVVLGGGTRPQTAEQCTETPGPGRVPNRVSVGQPLGIAQGRRLRTVAFGGHYRDRHWRMVSS